MRRAAFALLSLALACCFTRTARAEETVLPASEIVTVPTRDHVTVPYLLLGAPSPQAVALLFAGGNGHVDLESIRDHPPGDRGNFLVRSRELIRSPELAVAVLGLPSDHQDGIDDSFRSGKEHAIDVAAVVADLRTRLPGAKVFLVGTSAGTISAASTGVTLGQHIDGVVLSSTVFLSSRAGTALEGFDFGAIRVPTLLVHHADDGCKVCPYTRAWALSKRFPLVTVHGGKPPDSQPCEALSAHGYYGREAETAAAIRSWILGRPFPSEVG